MEQRAAALRQGIRAAGGKGAELPLVLIENSSRCITNDAKEKVLLNGVAWLTDFMQQVGPLPAWMMQGCSLTQAPPCV